MQLKWTRWTKAPPAQLFKKKLRRMQLHLNFIMFGRHASFFVIQMFLILLQVQPDQDIRLKVSIANWEQYITYFSTVSTNYCRGCWYATLHPFTIRRPVPRRTLTDYISLPIERCNAGEVRDYCRWSTVTLKDFWKQDGGAKGFLRCPGCFVAFGRKKRRGS